MDITEYDERIKNAVMEAFKEIANNQIGNQQKVTQPPHDLWWSTKDFHQYHSVTTAGLEIPISDYLHHQACTFMELQVTQECVLELHIEGQWQTYPHNIRANKFTIFKDIKVKRIRLTAVDTTATLKGVFAVKRYWYERED